MVSSSLAASVAVYEEFIKVMKSIWELVKDDKVHEIFVHGETWQYIKEVLKAKQCQ